MQEVPELAAWAGLRALWVKREDLNPTGSHKDRGAVEQVAAMVAAGTRVGVISSSGNAALAAATYGAPAGVTVVALVSPRTEPAKLAQLEASGARLIVTNKPINHALRLSRVRGWPDLRPSLSADALRGFFSLGQELADELPRGVALAAYASSGTTLEAIGRVGMERGTGLALHPIQAGLVDGFSREFGRPGDGRRSVVGDLGVKVSPRAAGVVDLVRASGGQAWWVADAEILEGRDALAGAGFEVAAECWAAAAGLRPMAEAGVTRACLLLTGRAVPPGAPPGEHRVAEDFAAVLAEVADL